MSEPEDFVKVRKQFGAWFKDPHSSGDTIWVIENFFKTRKFAQYESVEDLLGKFIFWNVFCRIIFYWKHVF